MPFSAISAFSDGLSFNISASVLFFTLEEFSALMKVLSTYRNTNAVVRGEGSQGSSSSAAHELRQRGTMFRLQGMNFENENLACNTKEAYSVYLKLFQVRA